MQRKSLVHLSLVKSLLLRTVPLLFCVLLLQGCLIDFFFAPKITEAELPGTVELNGLKAAYAQHCSRCHILIAPRYFDAERPIERYTGRYREANIISDLEQAEVNAYLRALRAESQSP